jgi:hypothetical protein
MDVPARSRGCPGHWFGRAPWPRLPPGPLGIGLGLVMCLSLGGCAGLKHSGEAEPRRAEKAPLPEETLAAYRAALERDDPQAAYRLLSPTVQQHIPYEKWAERWRETPAERAAQLKSLLDASNTPAAARAITLQAAIALPQGTVLLLAPSTPGRLADRGLGRRSYSRSGDWQVADPDLAAVHAETPERVLHLLIEAVEQRNYFALLRLLSTTERKALEAELRERVERLRTSLSKSKAPAIEVHGDRAHYQYDPRFFVDLVRERDGWRVLDLN